MKNKSPRGFTLIELLVVLSILSILAALLFPVFASARKRPKAAMCLSNQRQILGATLQYAADYDERMPYALSPTNKFFLDIGWSTYGPFWDAFLKTRPTVREILATYARSANLFYCPLDNTDSFAGLITPLKPTWFAQTGSSYLYDDLHCLLGWPLSSYPVPTENWVWKDGAYSHQPTAGQGMLAVGYADGHVKELTLDAEEKIDKRYSDLPTILAP